MSQLIPNTFGMQVFAKQVVTANSCDEIRTYWHNAIQQGLPVLVLGEGSNTLFTTDFDGVVILNRIKGIKVEEAPDEWRLHVGAGEIWHDVVTYSVKHQFYGLENLALIPGCVGSAPIQNIGAYGVEFQKIADYVELLELTTGRLIKVTDGQYGYRDSIFKRQYAKGYVVVRVGLKLSKCWQSTLTYGELKLFDKATTSAETIFEKVCEIRRTKLPDPKILGNGGSFFKNPLIDRDEAMRLLAHYPTMPIYPQTNDQIKLAAGWLIDQCGLKGYQLGGAAVHDKQALVLVNKNQATPDDVVNLARYVRQQVKQRFNISLSPEIRFMDQHGEIDADLLLAC